MSLLTVHENSRLALLPLTLLRRGPQNCGSRRGRDGPLPAQGSADYGPGAQRWRAQADREPSLEFAASAGCQGFSASSVSPHTLLFH